MSIFLAISKTGNPEGIISTKGVLNMTTDNTSNKPDFNVFAEKEGRTKRDDRLIRIGAAWQHRKGAGLNIQIDALPLGFNGKLVILSPSEKSE